MSVASIVADGPGRFRVSGVLDYGSVGALEAASRPLLASAPDAVVDLAGVERANSAALVLLLEWLDHAQRANRRIRFAGLPTSVLEIAGVSNVTRLLPVETPSGGSGPAAT
jgi:phospholipid transport system transporter-binding protein